MYVLIIVYSGILFLIHVHRKALCLRLLAVAPMQSCRTMLNDVSLSWSLRVKYIGVLLYVAHDELLLSQLLANFIVRSIISCQC